MPFSARVTRQVRHDPPPASARGGSVGFTLDTLAKRVASVAVVTAQRPATVRLYSAAGVLLRTIAQPAGQSQAYDVTADAIPYAAEVIDRGDGTAKVRYGPVWDGYF
jgi:hypothetical protein